MSKRNINKNILINFLRLILFSFHFFPQFIFCETCSSDSTSTSTPYVEGSCLKSVKTNQYHKCYSDSKYGSSRKYYAIGSGDSCVYGDSCKNFDTYIMRVYGTYECIESCAKINDSLKSNYIQYGDYCIHNSSKSILYDVGDEANGYELIPNNGYTILKCNLAEYNTTIERMNLTKCVKGDNCPDVNENGYQYTHYDYEEHKCIKSSNHCKDIKKKEIPADPDNNRQKPQCVSECIHEPYIYEYNNTCYKSSPIGTYYYNGTQRPLKSNDTCPDYILIRTPNNNTLCNKTCDGGRIYKVGEQKYCDTIINNCQQKGLKSYSSGNSHYCINKCNDTLELFGVETFQSNDTANLCIDNCYEVEKSYRRNLTLTENDDNKCVKSCFDDEFIYNLECVKPCPEEAKYFYVNDKGHKECVSKCLNGYYLNDTECVKKCHEGDGEKKYVNDSNVCVECSIGEGFKIYEATETDTIKRCYSKCPPDYLFHNYDNNICYSNKVSSQEYFNCFERKEAGSTDLNSYFKIDDPYTCYPSCNETDTHKNELEKYHCSNEFNCPDYYYTINSVKTCIEEQYLETCEQLNFMYLRGKECVPQCNGEEYRTLYVKGNIFQGIQSLGKCCSQKEDCGDKFYCNCENKLLRNTCPYKRIKNKDENNIISSSGGNCVMECPKEYPYESIDGTICNDTNYYQYYYKVSEDQYPKYKLIDDCKNINRYHINNSYECIQLDKCKIDNNYLYYDDDNVCYYSCLNLTNKFAFNSSSLNSQQKCMSSCPQGYYYLENEYICLDKCDYNHGLFYKYKDESQTGDNSQGNMCVEKCDDDQYVLNDNQCVKECPSYMFINTTLIQMGSKYLTINKCVDSCPSEAKYREEGGKKCLTECSSEGKKYILGTMCIEKCPEGFYIEGNECKSSCNNYFKKNYLDEAKTKYNYQCIQVCDNYTLSNKECIEKCPLGENFIGKNKVCRSTCNDELDDGIYYEKRDTGTQEGIDYIIYACVKNITNMSIGNYIVDGTTQIVDECPIDHPYLSLGERRCYDLCSKSKYYPFTAEYDNETKICATECKESKKYYGEDKICKTQCDNYTFNIINDEDNSCVAECDLKSPYKFKTYKEGRYHCSLQCDTAQPKYTTSDYVCYQDCPAPYNYEYKNECLLKCPDNLFSDFNKTVDNEDKYNCLDKCQTAGRLYYYRTDLKCIDKCKDEDYEIEDTKECSPFCDKINSVDYHYYIDTIDSTNIRKCVLNCPDAKPFLREDNQCYYSCNTNSYNYYTEDKICKNKCTDEYKIIKEKEDNTQAIFPCVLNCNSSYYLDIDKYCISSCENSYSGNKYFNTYEKICLPSCNKTLYYTEGYECVSSCSQGKFIDDRACRDFCPDEKRYFVGNYTHGEVNILPNECLYRCPDNYNFVSTKIKQDKDGKDHTLYICLGSCDHYINKEGNNECVDKCDGENKFYELDENGRKSCLSKCPEGAPYFYIENGQDSDIKCLEKCKENTYKEVNSNQCVEIEKCSSNIVDYEEKKCVYGCKSTQYWNETEFETGKKTKICLNKCIHEFGSYLSIGNECVKKCPEGLVVNYVDNTCVCPKLFVNAGTDGYKCLESSQCGKESGYTDFKYRLANSNECTKSCFGVLSTNRDLCYSSYNNCSHIPNTYIVSEGGNIRCDCQYNYYYIKDVEIDGERRKICLGENDECPVPYTYLNVTNKECIQECGDYKQLDYKCFKDCPDKTYFDEQKKICVYSNNWYVDENNGNIFLPPDAPCTPQYPYLIEETKECVNNCSKTKYSYIYKDICYSSCKTASDKNGEIPLSRVEPRSFSKYYQIVSYECQCDNKWYKDLKEDIICTLNNECPEDYKYIVKETKECVKSCPKDYPYNFNFECFESCENAKNSYQYPVKKVEPLFECSCENLWEKKDNIVVCSTNINCDQGKLLINDTRECNEGDSCPNEAPLKFNNVCYRVGSCPNNTKQNANGNECICNNLWYKQDTGNKYCLLDSECPFETHPNLIYSTKECITTDCPSPLKNFSNTCYEECPSGTIEDGNECKCDQQIGFWYIKEGNNKKPYIICGEDKCPSNMEYWNNNTKQCYPNRCSEYKLYEYNKVCYEKQCPNPTVSDDPENNPYECVTKKYSTSTNINETYNYIKEEIIDLYKEVKSTKPGGIIYNNFNTTMQLYGIKGSIQNTNTNSNSKDTVVRSGLSYIDIGSCSEKVFKNNRMDEDEDIVVLKFDLENQKKKSLINPVEYEFVSSKTGKKLDMSVCTKNDVVISYSLFDILNNFRRGKMRTIEEIESDEEFDNILAKIQKQYEKAKKIKEEYDMDTFNINSSLYEDICMTFQVKGRDLVLEDRVGYLYPEYSLCEENCTYSHIDFELERVYCNCPLKTDFDLSREHKFVLNENNSDVIMSRQKGPTNFAVIKCMSRLKESDSIKKNAGFFFTIIIIIFQVILLFITIFYNYKNLKAKINKNSVINSDEDFEKEFNVEKIDVKPKKNITNKKINNFKNDVNIKTSERPLNSPPPKKRGDLKVDKVSGNDMKLKNKVFEEKEKEKENEKINNDINETINELSENIDDDFSDDSISKDYFTDILDSVRNEEKLLRIKFESAIQSDQSNTFIMILTEIWDKIYLIKTLCLLGKYEMFSIYFSLYLLYHLLLLSFIVCFYNIETIHNIYIMDNYPSISHDLGYGLLSCLIVWVIYKIFLCILNNDEAIKKYIRKRINSSNDSENVRKNNKKFNDLLCSIKTGMIVYFALQFVLAVVCLLYVTVFCAVYVGTKKKIFKSYGIALIEVVIIKIIYGIILGILRKVGLSKQNAVAYKIAYYLDRFLH